MATIQLGKQDLEDLRTMLRKTYGEVFESSLTDTEVNGLGSLFIVCLGEYLKLGISHPELFAEV